MCTKKTEGLTDRKYHGAQRERWHNPRHFAELRPGEPKQRHRQQDRSNSAPRKSGLRNRYTTISLSRSVVHPVLMDRGHERKETSENGGDIWKSSISLTPSMVALKGERNDGEEQENDSPCESQPERKRQNDWFADEEDESASGRCVEECTYGRFGKF